MFGASAKCLTPVSPVASSSPSNNALLSQTIEYNQSEAMLNTGMQVSPYPVSVPGITPKIAFGSQEIVCRRHCQDRHRPWALRRSPHRIQEVRTACHGYQCTFLCSTKDWIFWYLWTENSLAFLVKRLK